VQTSPTPAAQPTRSEQSAPAQRAPRAVADVATVEDEGERERPDLLSEDERAVRAQERRTLLDRWDQQAPDHEASGKLQAALEERLIGRSLPLDAVSSLACRRTLCRFQLASLGRSGLTPTSEVYELILAVRDLGETWLDAIEVRPGEWRVEAFAPTENHTLTGPGIE
jgi:hypothetical protein